MRTKETETTTTSDAYNAALEQILAISKEAVDRVGKDVIKEQRITKHGRGMLTNTDCYRLVLCYIESELEETFDLSLIEDPDELTNARRKLQMHIWRHYPKNPSAYQKHVPFFPDEDNGSVAVMDKYGDV